MKRLFSISLAVVMCFCLSVSAMAADFRDPSTAVVPDGLGHDISAYIVMKDTSIDKPGNYVLFAVWTANDDPLIIMQTADYSGGDSDRLYITDAQDSTRNVGVLTYYLDDTGTWVYDNRTSASPSRGIGLSSTRELVFCSVEIRTTDGDVWYSPVTLCDGTDCPATDADKDNRCDDCEKMLVMSLRTSLLQFARYHVEESIKVYTQMPYWLITEDAVGGYTCIISQQPLTYSNNTLYTGGNMRVGTAKILSSGENAATAWEHISTGSVPVDGEAVDANYKIEGFFPTPLWRMMNKVTQGEMGLLTGETVGTMKIMALSGVGCLALLTVLKLFGKRSLMFLR